MGFGKTIKFMVENRTGTDLKNVRISHFMKGDEYAKDAEVEVIVYFGKIADPEGPFSFKSISGKNDHWSVAFENTHGCWMSYDLDKSMSDKYREDGYRLIIEKEKFTFHAIDKKGDVSEKSTDVTTIYNATKSK